MLPRPSELSRTLTLMTVCSTRPFVSFASSEFVNYAAIRVDVYHRVVHYSLHSFPFLSFFFLIRSMFVLSNIRYFQVAKRAEHIVLVVEPSPTCEHS